MDELIKFLKARHQEAAKHVEFLRGMATLSPPQHGRYLRDAANDLGRDLEVKKRIINELWDKNEGLPTEPAATATATVVLRLLALRYFDHREYRQEWRP